jgi:phage terminase large subunit-like protein
MGVREREVEEPDAHELIARLRETDICWWAEEDFYVPTGGKIIMPPHQKVVSRVLLRRGSDGHFANVLIVYSTVKQSGKSTWSGVVGKWMAETQSRLGRVYFVANDLKQAEGRGFAEVRHSITLTPGFDHARQRLPGRWRVLERSMTCLTSGTVIEAVPVDAAGEAGGKPALSVWTELWNYTRSGAIEMWNELARVPTLPDSIKIVETYAGKEGEGESKLLRDIYDRGMAGHQMTNHEAATIAARDRDGERYEDMLRAWHECWPDDCGGTGSGRLCRGDPEAPIPIWVDANGLAMYWDSEEAARRMSWQRGPRGVRYYTQEEADNLPEVFAQHHRNVWTETQTALFPSALWDACRQEIGPFEPGDDTPCWIGVDAASTSDHFGILAVTRHPDPARYHTDVAVRAVRVWKPPPGGAIDHSEPEGFLRFLLQGGCAAGHPQYDEFRRRTEDCQEGGQAAGKDPCGACDAIATGDNALLVRGYNVFEIAYDHAQLEGMMQRFTREAMMSRREKPNGIGYAPLYEFSQKEEREIADRRLYDLVVNRRLAHDGNAALREHVLNAAKKVQKLDDSKMRIVKRNERGGKIDLVVCLSMASDRCLKALV